MCRKKMMNQEWIDTNSQIKFKTILLNSRLCDNSDIYIIVKRNIAVWNTIGADV